MPLCLISALPALCISLAPRAGGRLVILSRMVTHAVTSMPKTAKCACVALQVNCECCERSLFVRQVSRCDGLYKKGVWGDVTFSHQKSCSNIVKDPEKHPSLPYKGQLRALYSIEKGVNVETFGVTNKYNHHFVVFCVTHRVVYKYSTLF